MKDMEKLSLLDLQLMIRDGVESAVPEKLWIRAEVASVQAKSNGHCYLELSQSEDGRLVAKARAVIWKSVWYALRRYFLDATGSELSPGMQILVRVQASYSELYGLTLVIDELEPEFTLGAAELEKRKTIERLEKEGLIGRQKELELAELPYALAVVSASDAAGFGDFRRHLTENEFGFKFKVELFPATMQGESAPASIVDALQQIEADGGYDAALILRGGGSVLDLACFDDYDLAFTIANCGIPVFTAIGHDRDYHVADMVANTFVKTPTALADLFLDCYISEDQRISAVETVLRTAFISRLSSMEMRLMAAATAVTAAASGRIANEEARLALLEVKIASADPKEVLSRGYSLVTDASGVKMNTVASSKPGDKITVFLGDGSLGCTVDSVLGQ